MAKTETIRTRIEPGLKANIEKILNKLGLSVSEALHLFCNQVVLHKGLPFDVRLPAASTRQALQDVKDGKLNKAKNYDDLMNQLND